MGGPSSPVLCSQGRFGVTPSRLQDPTPTPDRPLPHHPRPYPDHAQLHLAPPSPAPPLSGPAPVPDPAHVPDHVSLPAEIECLVEVPAPQDYWGPLFAVCIFLFSFIIPVFIISVCYSLMIRRLRGVRLLSGSREKDRNLRRITRLVLVVVAVFVGCWTPVQVFVLVQGLGVQPGSETAVAILRFCTALGYVNSCLNPILYAFLDENFKACFRKFCCASALRREVPVSDRVRSIAKDVALACKTSETVPRPA